MSAFAGVLQLDHSPIAERVLSRLCAAMEGGGMERREVAGGSLQRLGNAQSGCVAFLASGMMSLKSASTQDGKVWALCDGRLDNWDELAPLCEKSCGFQAPFSTAQGILAAYRKWGADCPQHLLGDYVFVLWDNHAKRLLCGRDPAQSRPLYYVFDGRTFHWASDTQVLLNEPDVSHDCDPVYLTTYMVMSSLNWERTPYEMVKQLPGGHALTIAKGALKAWQWWQLPEPGSLRLKCDEEYQERLRSLMYDAVRARMQSDSPVSIALSRGIDSASIAAAAKHVMHNGKAPCPAVECISFAPPSHREADESADARLIAEHLGLSHRVVTPANEVFDFTVPLRQLPEPNGVVTHWNEWNAVREACVESGSRVLMTGAGGELLESPFFYMADLAREKRWPMLGRELWRWKQAGTSLPAAIKATLRGLQEPPFHWQPEKKLGFYPWLRDAKQCRREFRSLSLRHPVVRDSYHMFVEKGGAMGAMQTLFAPSNIEIRNPLSDRRLVEFAYSLPLERKLRRETPGGKLMNKPLLRLAFSDLLPIHLTKPNAPLRAHNGESFRRYQAHVRELLDNSPQALSEVVDLRVLREHLYQLQQDTGGKRYVALTSLLTCWLAHSQQANSNSRIVESNATYKEVTI